MSTIVCEQCGKEFPRPTSRGRPPKRCDPCRNPVVEVKDKVEGEERYLALELMLKSRGIHLSQQKEAW